MAFISMFYSNNREDWPKIKLAHLWPF